MNVVLWRLPLTFLCNKLLFVVAKDQIRRLKKRFMEKERKEKNGLKKCLNILFSEKKKNRRRKPVKIKISTTTLRQKVKGKEKKSKNLIKKALEY